MPTRILAVVALTAAAACFPAAAADEAATAELRACAALTGRDVEIVEHLPREAIEEVRKLLDAPPSTPFTADSLEDEARTILAGATVIVRPMQGLTVERLRRLVQCGLARANAEDPMRPTDWPRTPPGTTAYVGSGGDVFIIELRAGNPGAAEAMWRTAQQLKPSTD